MRAYMRPWPPSPRRYPNNEHLYRMYAKFLGHVKNDPWTAQRFNE